MTRDALRELTVLPRLISPEAVINVVRGREALLTTLYDAAYERGMFGQTLGCFFVIGTRASPRRFSDAPLRELSDAIWREIRRTP